MSDAYDIDLQSIQEARQCAIDAKKAQKEFSHVTQEQVDRVCEAMADAAFKESERLAYMANEETGFGVPAHKTIKNQFSSRTVWESIKNEKTVGMINRDPDRNIVEFAWPVGVIGALIPSTNPTSTAMYKILVAVKARNGIVIAPHPSAKNCSAETVRVMMEAGEAAGMPKGLVSCLKKVTLPGTQELMKHYAVSLIMATGGTPMVRAAHGVGKPAIGVGPGNVPAYVDKSADVKKAASDIVNSKAFDCSVICATEQSVVAHKDIADELRAEMKKNGAYWVDDEQKKALERTLFRPDGVINPASVGKTPQKLARMAGITVPESARILVAELSSVGKDCPLSREKLTTVIGFYVEKDWRAGCERCIELLKFGGDGHSLVIHSKDEEVTMAFGLEKPAFRIIVNTWGTLGAVGATTGLVPSMTLAPGGIGGSVLSDNISTRHLMNVKRLAYQTAAPPKEAYILAPDVAGSTHSGASSGNGNGNKSDDEMVIEAVRRVLSKLGT
jgi:acetaldehyde dehydrogenase (acetylating)